MSIDFAIKKINELSSFLTNQRPKLLFEPATMVEKRMKERIFLKGLDSNEDIIYPVYSKKWAKEREERGLQTAYYDLKFTGRLINNMKTKPDEQQVVIFIDDDFDYQEKVLYFEDKLDKPIFLATDKEVDLVTGLFEYELDFYLDVILE